MSKTRRFYSLVILNIIACVLMAAAAFADGQKIPYWEPLDRARVIEAAREVTRDVYPDADVVDLDQKHWIRYQDDGTYVEWYECYSKVLTEKGRKSLKTISSYFTIPYNTTEITLVEVFKKGAPEGVGVDVKSNSRVMVDQSQMKSGIYNPNDRILFVNIPELETGDIVHFIMFDDHPKVRVPGTWSDYVNFEGINPLKRSEYTVVAPKTMPLVNITVKSEIPGIMTHTKQASDDLIIYKWVAKDVPRAFPEPDMPPLYTQTQRLLISTIKDWQTISRWYWNLSRPNIEKTTSEMKRMVEKLTEDASGPEEKIEKIFKWVSQEIRYLGITVEENAPGYEPHPADMTFDRRAGVCRDKAALLVAMLRMAEFDAYPVIIMSGPKKDPDVPQPFFNHAITCVKKEDGAYVLMDPTDESTKQFLPAYLGNCSYLVATPEGETLRVSPVEPAERNMMHIRTKAALDRSGGFNAESVLTFEGINDNMYRGYFSRLSSDERRGYFERIIRKFMPAALLSDYEISPANILDTNNPLKVRLSFEAKNILISGESIVMVPMPLMGKSIGMVSYLTKETGLEKRKYPLFAGYACGFDETFELDTEQSVGRPASLPEYENIENGEFTWNRSTSFEKGSLVGRNIFKMKLPEYSPEEYSSLKEILEKTEYEDRKMPIFSKPSESDEDTWCSSFGTDAVILNETDEYDIENAGNWTETKHVKMKILTYAGKKDNGDIYINYNPVWEDVKILKASVTSSSGNTKTVRDEEINEMDAGWAGYAPRYPAAKTLVVSLPGVEKGSVIEYTIERKKKDRLFFYANEDIIKKWTEAPENHAFFSVDGIFSYYYPILKKTIRIRAPANLDLKIFKSDTGIGPEMTDNPGLNNIIKEKVEKAGKFTIHEFTARKVPPVKNEGYLPPWYGFNPLVTASAGDWKRYVREVEKALLRAASSQPRAEAKAKEITGDIKGDTARITAIRDFAAKNIRPVDIELGDMPMGYITPADRTLADGYGNSADRAVLLYSLLSAAGYSPEFVLLSESSRVPSLQELVRRYPAPCLFQYVLVRVETDKGYIYLNDTDQYARLGSTPNRGYPVLILKSGETKTVDISGADLKDKTCTSFSITLSGDGDAIIKRTRKVYGMDFASFHRQFAEMTPEELKRHNQELVASVSQSAVPHGEYLVDYDVYPGIEEFSVKVKNYAILQDDYLYMKLPGIASGIRGTESGSRENPLYRDLAIKDFTNIEVVMPANAYSIRIKPAGSFLFEFGEYGRISIKSDVSYIKPMCLNVRQDIDIDPVIVASEDYPRFLEASRILGRPETEMLVLKMKKVGTPVP